TATARSDWCTDLAPTKRRSRTSRQCFARSPPDKKRKTPRATAPRHCTPDRQARLVGSSSAHFSTAAAGASGLAGHHSAHRQRPRNPRFTATSGGCKEDVRVPQRCPCLGDAAFPCGGEFRPTHNSL